ncbi:MAG: class II aldolase/adducin family protein [Oscillospiraceae bacterium]|nr:class II aldolase/adducin family protein [Oscillospiraceae bacterium]MDY3937331.1 class II aldolase/adducin family protein [Oscillospiraceae bacterium]
MDIMTAKETVITAGKRLVESGLIARTWGNVSCRVDDNSFVITPSGRSYETLTPDEIVLVKIDDLSYDGDVKPSSEKGIHAQAYKLRPEINFVIHTHQMNASAISFLGSDINCVPAESRDIIGSDIPVASYGLPGTGKLKKGVTEALERSNSKAAIMAHHGAVCLGVDYEDAFKVASELEKVCEGYLKNTFYNAMGKTAQTVEEIADYFAAINVRQEEYAQYDPYTSEREGETMNMYDEDGNVTRINLLTGENISGGDYPETMELHREVYRRRKDVNSVIHSKKPEIVAVSKIGKTMKPLLDDFAQLIGITVRGAEYDPGNTVKSAKKVVRKLRGRNAVLLSGNGALCAAGDKSDAEAVEMVLEKGARAQISADLIGGAKAINPVEALLMRVVYKTKYSKQKK